MRWPLHASIDDMKRCVLRQEIPIELLGREHLKLRLWNLEHLIGVVRILSLILVLKPRAGIVVLLEVDEEGVHACFRIKILFRCLKEIKLKLFVRQDVSDVDKANEDERYRDTNQILGDTDQNVLEWF